MREQRPIMNLNCELKKSFMSQALKPFIISNQFLPVQGNTNHVLVFEKKNEKKLNYDKQRETNVSE